MKVDQSVIDDPAKLKQFEEAQQQLSGALSRLMVVVERYPELKATESFRDLQSQLEGTENRITVARKRFIESVAEYNKVVQVFPSSIGASMRGKSGAADVHGSCGSREAARSEVLTATACAVCRPDDGARRAFRHEPSRTRSRSPKLARARQRLRRRHPPEAEARIDAEARSSRASDGPAVRRAHDAESRRATRIEDFSIRTVEAWKLGRARSRTTGSCSWSSRTTARCASRSATASKARSPMRSRRASSATCSCPALPDGRLRGRHRSARSRRSFKRGREVPATVPEAPPQRSAKPAPAVFRRRAHALALLVICPSCAVVRGR